MFTDFIPMYITVPKTITKVCCFYIWFKGNTLQKMTFVFLQTTWHTIFATCMVNNFYMYISQGLDNLWFKGISLTSNFSLSFQVVKLCQGFGRIDKPKGLPVRLLQNLVSNSRFISSVFDKSPKTQLSCFALFLSPRAKDNLQNQFQRHFPKTRVYQYFRDKKFQIGSLHLLWKTYEHIFPNTLPRTYGYCEGRRYSRITGS